MFDLLAIIARSGWRDSPDSLETDTPHWLRTVTHAVVSLALMTLGILQVATQRVSIRPVSALVTGSTWNVLRFEGQDAIILGCAFIAGGSAYFSHAVLTNLPVTWRFAQPLWVLSLLAFCFFMLWTAGRFFAHGGIF